MSNWRDDKPLPVCLCAIGFQKDGETSRCTRKTKFPFLVLAKSKPASLQGIDLETGNETAFSVVGLSQPSAIDFDVNAKSIVYCDSRQSVIKSVAIDGADNVSKIWIFLVIRSIYEKKCEERL